MNKIKVSPIETSLYYVKMKQENAIELKKTRSKHSNGSFKISDRIDK